MDDFGSDMFDTLRGRGMVVLAPTMGFTHGYSWFDPFRIISLKKLIYGDHIFLFHRPRSGQTMNSPRYNRGYRNQYWEISTLKGLN
jgi:hypothetical protein